jgi:hypothetical protein
MYAKENSFEIYEKKVEVIMNLIVILKEILILE